MALASDERFVESQETPSLPTGEQLDAAMSAYEDLEAKILPERFGAIDDQELVSLMLLSHGCGSEAALFAVFTNRYYKFWNQD